MNDFEFDQLLRTTVTPAATPAGFQRDVWIRIGAEESNGWKPYLKRILCRFFGFVALPPVALASCAAMALVGVWLGTESAHPKQSYEVAYVQSISPFSQTHR